MHKHTIIALLNKALAGLAPTSQKIYIIGGAGIILGGYAALQTADIDILCAMDDSPILKKQLNKYLINDRPIPSARFRSEFSQYLIDGTKIELMGGLEIKGKDGLWKVLEINESIPLNLDHCTVYIPSRSEYQRLLALFGRDKDLQKLNLLL